MDWIADYVVSTKSEDLINFIACSMIFASNNAVKVVRDMIPGGYADCWFSHEAAHI